MVIVSNLFKRPNLKAGVLFGSSSVISGVIAMVIGILIIGWINPAELGIWQSLSILQLYVPFLEMGIPNGLNRELPYLYGKGENARGIQYAQAAQSFMISVAILFLTATLITTFILFSNRTDPKVMAGIATVGLLVSVNAYQRYLTVTYRSEQSFISLSKLYIYQVFIQILLLPIVWYEKYYGLLAYSFLVPFGFTALMHFARPIKERPVFNITLLKDLSTIGFPVFAMGYLRGVANSFNRVVLLMKSGTVTVGLFTPVNAIGTLITMLPGVLGNFFFPKMNYMLGATEDPKKLWPIIVKINLVILLFSIPFIVGVWVTTPLLVGKYFVEYKTAIPAMQIFSLNFLFSGTLVSHNAIYTLKAYTLGYIFVALELIFRFVCPYAAIHFLEGNVLTLSAYGVLISNALLFGFNFLFLRIAINK